MRSIQPETNFYSGAFFSNQKHGAFASAEAMAPLIMDLVRPGSVIDVGCGVGAWLSVFSRLGVSDLCGVDGAYVDQDQLLISRDKFVSADLTRAFRCDRKFDLVACLEVAEHLPGAAAPILIDTLTRLGPVVLFSAAIPFQGGNNHINEQWPEYWATLFRRKEFEPFDCVRPLVWNDERVMPCYAQNSLLFVQLDYLNVNNGLRRRLPPHPAEALSLVHPKIYLDRADPKQYCMRQAFEFFSTAAKNRLKSKVASERSRRPRV